MFNTQNLNSSTITKLCKRTLYSVILISPLCALSAYAGNPTQQTLIDPTLPLQNHEDVSDASSNLSNPAPNYKLSSILVRQNKKTAVLNSQLVSIGDTVGNATVMGIGNKQVDLLIEGESTILTVYKNSIKTFSANEVQNLVVINP